MKIVLLDGIVMAKAWFDAVDKNYDVIERLRIKWFFKIHTVKVIVKDLLFNAKIIQIENFNAENRYYCPVENAILYKPHCDMYLSNGDTQTKFFETKEELSEFMNLLLENKVTIEI